MWQEFFLLYSIFSSFENTFGLGWTWFKSNDNGKSKKLQGFESKISVVSGEEQLFECTKCDIKFKIWTNYAIHLRLHSFDKPLKCAKCGKTWQNSNELAQHYKIHTT